MNEYEGRGRKGEGIYHVINVPGWALDRKGISAAILSIYRERRRVDYQQSVELCGLSNSHHHLCPDNRLNLEMPPPLKPITTCMEKYILYETASFYYLVGCDAVETYFRVLKLNRTIIKPKSLDEILMEDPLVYNKDELGFMLEMIHEGNKTTGGLVRTTIAYGLVGFVKFLDCYYFTLVTQRKKVGCVGSNFIYSIKAAEVFAIRPREDTSGELSIMKIWKTVNRKLNKTNTDQAESRYMGLFQFIDISKDFFFSYTYDLTHSLQHNFLMSSSNAYPPPPFRVSILYLLSF